MRRTRRAAGQPRRIDRVDAVEIAGVLVVERLQQHGVDDAIDDGARGDAERQRDDRSGREREVLGEYAPRELQIAAERVEPSRRRHAQFSRSAAVTSIREALRAGTYDASVTPEHRQRNEREHPGIERARLKELARDDLTQRDRAGDTENDPDAGQLQRARDEHRQQAAALRAKRRPHGDLVEPLIHRERHQAVRADCGQYQRHDAEHDEHAGAEPVPRERRRDDVRVNGEHGGIVESIAASSRRIAGISAPGSSVSERTTTAILRMVRCSCGR